MEQLPLTVCVTTLNEEKSISGLIEALVNQSRKPNKIIIVDSKSKDNTVSIINYYLKKYKFIKLIIRKGSRAHCRNLAINNSKDGLIALTDAGCIPKIDWIERLVGGFKPKETDLVAGFYNMPFNNSFQKAARVYLGILPSRFDNNNFVPSARSVAFRKSIWSRVGRFNEKLRGGAEDTEFFYRCIKNNININRVKQARVEWTDIKTLNFLDIIRKFYTYTKGDGNAKIWWHPLKKFSSHNIKIITVFFRLLLLVLLFVIFNTSKNNLLLYLICALIFMYLVYPIIKWRKEIKNISSKIFLPILQITLDVVSMYGFLVGSFKSK